MISVRSSILVFLFSLALSISSLAQSGSSDTSTAKMGTLVYLEGSVEVKTDDDSWTAAQIEQPLRRTEMIRTGPGATVEIKWQNGTKSAIGPQSKQEIETLYDTVRSQSGQNSGGFVEEFVELFQRDDTSSENDVGGIRRASVEMEDTPGQGELYWKTLEEVSFDDAQQAFKEQNYMMAARKFHLFVQQNPDHTMAAKAKLGMGVCYLKLNNPSQARSAFESVVSDHPDDPLSDRARKMLEQL